MFGIINILNTKTRILLLLAVAALALAIPLTIIQVQKQQEIRQRANEQEVKLFFSNSENCSVVLTTSLQASASNVYFYLCLSATVGVSGFDIALSAKNLEFNVTQTIPSNQFDTNMLDKKMTSLRIRGFVKDITRNAVLTQSIPILKFSVANAELNSTVSVANAEVSAIGRTENYTPANPTLTFSSSVGAAAPQAVAPTTPASPSTTSTLPETIATQLTQSGFDTSIVEQVLVLREGTTWEGWDKTAPAVVNTLKSYIVQGEKVSIKFSQLASVTIGGKSYGLKNGWMDIDSWPTIPTSTSAPASTSQRGYLCTLKAYPITKGCSGEVVTETKFCSLANDYTRGCLQYGSSYSSVACVSASLPADCSYGVPASAQANTNGGGGGGGGQPGPVYPPLTATLAAGEIRLNLTLGLRAIGQAQDSPKRRQRIVQIKLYSKPLGAADSEFVLLESNRVSLSYLNYDAPSKTGKFEGNVIMSRTLRPGTYKISMEIPGYLKKEYTLGDINEGETRKDYTPDNIPPFFAGDISGDGTALDISDYNLLRNCLRNTSCTDADRAAADINDDGIVNAIDYNTWLREVAAWRSTQ